MFSEPGADDVAAQGAEPDALASADALAHKRTDSETLVDAKAHGNSDVPAVAHADSRALRRAHRQQPKEATNRPQQ